MMLSFFSDAHAAYWVFQLILLVVGTTTTTTLTMCTHFFISVNLLKLLRINFINSKETTFAFYYLAIKSLNRLLTTG